MKPISIAEGLTRTALPAAGMFQYRIPLTGLSNASWRTAYYETGRSPNYPAARRQFPWQRRRRAASIGTMLTPSAALPLIIAAGALLSAVAIRALRRRQTCRPPATEPQPEHG